jgi:hypothetical protein
MNAIEDTLIEFGQTGDPPQDFKPDCTVGDWQSYQVGLKKPFQSADNVRVIVTANDYSGGISGGITSKDNPAVVGVVWGVSTAGFTLWARNSDSEPGKAGFYYMAVEELGKPPQGVEGVDLRFGILQQKFFRSEGQPEAWQTWDPYPRFSTPLAGKNLAALVTGCNLNVRSTNVPAVGISRDLDFNGFELAARNSAACLPTTPRSTGACAFYYVAGVNEHLPKDSFWIDSGVADAEPFEASCEEGWTASWEVYFSRPFLSPPIVLLTCKDADAAVVGLARDVTTHGFTLAGLNSDCGAGNAQFYWVAIGCGLGCG